MKFKNFLNTFVLFLYPTVAFANQCDDLQLKNNIYNVKCEVDSDGNAKTLYISSGTITQDNINEIATLTSLEELTIWSVDYLNTVDLEPLSSLKELKKFDNLSNDTDKKHYLTAFPKFLYSLPKLEYMRFLQNDFIRSNTTTFTEEILNLKNIKTIYFGSTGVMGDISILSKLTSLEELRLTYNKLEGELPESLSTLPNLKIVDFSHNYFTGKTLTNESLVSCKYGTTSTLCKAKEMSCFDKNENIKRCDDTSDDHVSTNHKCGNGNGRCPEGQCCSKYGWCGKSKEYCNYDNGCQPVLGECKNYPIYNTSGLCGKENGKCLPGQCCNKNGECGTTKDHCKVSRGCQTSYGVCFTTDNKCGEGVARCPEDQCCSRYGWCGRSEDHCGQECQSEFGKCNKRK